jgi:hypothetical protein
MFDQRERMLLEFGGCTDADIQALAAQAQSLPEGLQKRLLHTKDLIIEQDKGVIEALEHIILDSKFANLEDVHVLGWLPLVVLDEVIAWLEAEAEDEGADEE